MSWSLQFDPNDFLHSVCKFVVATCATMSPAVTLQYAGTPRSLWRDLAAENTQANPSQCADPYTVVRTYLGSPLLRNNRLPRQSLQFQTCAVLDAQGKAMSGSICQAFTDSDGSPLRMITINGYKADGDTADGTYLLVACDPLQRPGLTGRDKNGRGLFSFNIEIAFRKAS